MKSAVFIAAMLGGASADQNRLDNGAVVFDVENAENRNTMNMMTRSASDVGMVKPLRLTRRPFAEKSAENMRSQSENKIALSRKRSAAVTPAMKADNSNNSNKKTKYADNYSSLLKKQRAKKIVRKNGSFDTDKKLVVSFGLEPVDIELKFLLGQTVHVVQRNVDVVSQAHDDLVAKRKLKKFQNMIEKHGRTGYIKVYVPIDDSFRVIHEDWLCTQQAWPDVSKLRDIKKDLGAIRRYMPVVTDSRTRKMFEQRIEALEPQFEIGDIVCGRDENSPFAHTRARVVDVRRHPESFAAMVTILANGEQVEVFADDVKYWIKEEHFADEIKLTV